MRNCNEMKMPDSYDQMSEEEKELTGGWIGDNIILKRRTTTNYMGMGPATITDYEHEDLFQNYKYTRVSGTCTKIECQGGLQPVEVQTSFTECSEPSEKFLNARGEAAICIGTIAGIGAVIGIGYAIYSAYKG